METNTRIAGFCFTGFWDDHSTPPEPGLGWGGKWLKPNSSTTVTTAINSIERFIDLDLLHSLDFCSSPTDRLADPKEAHKTALGRARSQTSSLGWNTPSIALEPIHHTIMRGICQEISAMVGEAVGIVAASPRGGPRLESGTLLDCTTRDWRRLAY